MELNQSMRRWVAWGISQLHLVTSTGKTLRKYLDAEDPSVLILTETRCSKGKPDIMCLKTKFKVRALEKVYSPCLTRFSISFGARTLNRGEVIDLPDVLPHIVHRTHYQRVLLYSQKQSQQTPPSAFPLGLQTLKKQQDVREWFYSFHIVC